MARPYKYTKEVCNEMAKRLDRWMENPTHFWLGEFAVEEGINRHTLQELADRPEDHEHYSEELSATYKKAKQIQENRIVKLGFSRLSNPAFAIFTLKNVAGWRDAKVVSHDGTLLHLLQEIRKRNEPLVKENYEIIEPKQIEDAVVKESEPFIETDKKYC